MDRLLSRLMRKVSPEPNSGCWLWAGNRNSSGYGMLRITVAPFRYRHRVAHRVAYEALCGPIPHGLQLDHLCRNPACVNPDHLEPVTAKENVRRGMVKFRAGIRNREKTHCPKGHPLSGDNLVKHEPRRKCRTCKNERQRRKGA